MRILSAGLLLMLATSAAAERPLTRNEQAVINFGFATQLGSGVYSLSGRTLQVYRLPFAYAPAVDEEARVRPRITLPLTLGFVDFKPRDVVETGVPERIDSLSFVPGLAMHIAVREDWELEPFAEAGIARDQASEADQNVHAAGLRSRFDFGGGPTDWQLYNELVYAVVEQDSLDRTDDFTRFRIGTTARRPFDTERSGQQSPAGRRSDAVRDRIHARRDRAAACLGHQAAAHRVWLPIRRGIVRVSRRLRVAVLTGAHHIRSSGTA